MAQSFPETYRPDPKLYKEGYDNIDWGTIITKTEKKITAIEEAEKIVPEEILEKLRESGITFTWGEL